MSMHVRYLYLLTFSFILNASFAQAPPAIQWQKCIGGSANDNAYNMNATPDGGYIITGTTDSEDGDFSIIYGVTDVFVIKIDAVGNVQWKKTYGGKYFEYGSVIKPTKEGGYILLGTTRSNDGDVSGNHGGSSDVWLVKLDKTGNIEWQKCFGGLGSETGSSIQQTSDGGYIIGAYTTMNGGDITNYHSNLTEPNRNDVWIIKTDNVGNIQWQRCYGGRNDDDLTRVIETVDGGYFFASITESSDGDVINLGKQDFEDLWIVKLDNTGNILWQNLAGGNYGESCQDMLQTSDGGFIIAGVEYADDVPGIHGTGGDGWVIKFDKNGIFAWQRFLGGTDRDELKSITETSDGYVVTGNTNSTNDDICTNRGYIDLFMAKLNNQGNTVWRRTCGGTFGDFGTTILATNDGGYIACGYTYSNDGDIIGNHKVNAADIWILKFSFPGIDILPTIHIAASETTICTGKAVNFTSDIMNGGDDPSYKWMINGQVASTDSASTTFTTLQNGDKVSCLLTSNSGCVTDTNALSNVIPIAVNSLLTPTNFLTPNLDICSYGNLKVESYSSYKSYLWNTGATTQSIIVDDPGVYWLRVVDDSDCPGTDSIAIKLKPCVLGFHMPNAFTPNGDGKNDIFKPTIGGVVLQYRLVIYNRWGQVVFQTTDFSKGWDGSFKGRNSSAEVFIWSCIYQLRDEPVISAKGTVTLIP